MVAGERRLVFWLQLSFAADFVFAALGIALLWSDEVAGFYLIAFTVLRAILGSIALFWIAPRAARELRRPPDGEEPDDGLSG